MRTTRTDIMGMPLTVELVDGAAGQADIDAVFEYFMQVDERFSTYKPESEVSRVNRGELSEAHYSDDLQEVLALAEHTKNETRGYFNSVRPDGSLDPSGVVKGWAVKKAADLLKERGIKNFMIEAAGDIAVHGKNAGGGEWSIGIRNPFIYEEIVKVLYPKGRGVATSGSAARGAHIYNPHDPSEELTQVVSVTVVGPDVLAADRFATAAFAMGREGISFLETMPGLEGYCIDKDGIATMTSGFTRYTTI